MEKRSKWHPLYLWGIAYIVLTYLYVGGVFYGADINNNTLIYVSMATPFVLTLINIVLAITLRNKIHRDHFLGTAVLMKYCVLPYQLAGMAIGALGVLSNIIVPFLVIFAGFAVAFIVFLFGYVTLLGTVPFMFVYLMKGKKEGSFHPVFATVIEVLQFIFFLDLISSLVAAFKEKKLVIGTIAAVVITVLLLMIGGIALLIKIFTY